MLRLAMGLIQVPVVPPKFGRQYNQVSFSLKSQGQQGQTVK